MIKPISLMSALSLIAATNFNYTNQLINNTTENSASIDQTPQLQKKSLIFGHDLFTNESVTFNKQNFQLPNNYKQFKINKLYLETSILYNMLNFAKGEQFTNFNFELNNWQLTKTTEIIENDQKIEVQLKSTHNIQGLTIHGSIPQIYEANYQKYVSFGVVKSKLINTKLTIDYEYFENNPTEDEIERKICDFFNQEHDLGLSNLDNGYQVLNKLKRILQNIVGDEKIQVDLFYKDYNIKNSEDKDIWQIQVSLTKGIVKNNQAQFFNLKLKNIKIYPQIIQKMVTIFEKNTWNFSAPETYKQLSSEDRQTNSAKIITTILETNNLDNVAIEKHIIFETKRWNANNELKIDVIIAETNDYIGTLTITNFEQDAEE